MSSGFTLWCIQLPVPLRPLGLGAKVLGVSACQKSAGSSGQTRSRCTNAEEPTEGEERRSREWRRWVLAVPCCRGRGSGSHSGQELAPRLGGDIVERCPQVAGLLTAPLEHLSWGWCPQSHPELARSPQSSCQRRGRPESAKLDVSLLTTPIRTPTRMLGP